MLTEAQRDELLIRLDERTYRADKALFGNGGGPQQGLVSRVAVLEEDMDVRKEEALTLRSAVARKDVKTLATSGLFSVALFIAAVVAKLLGIPVPI